MILLYCTQYLPKLHFTRIVLGETSFLLCKYVADIDNYIVNQNRDRSELLYPVAQVLLHEIMYLCLFYVLHMETCKFSNTPTKSQIIAAQIFFISQRGKRLKGLLQNYYYFYYYSWNAFHASPFHTTTDQSLTGTLISSCLHSVHPVLPIYVH